MGGIALGVSFRMAQRGPASWHSVQGTKSFQGRTSPCMVAKEIELKLPRSAQGGSRVPRRTSPCKAWNNKMNRKTTTRFYTNTITNTPTWLVSWEGGEWTQGIQNVVCFAIFLPAVEMCSSVRYVSVRFWNVIELIPSSISGITADHHWSSWRQQWPPRTIAKAFCVQVSFL